MKPRCAALLLAGCLLAAFSSAAEAAYCGFGARLASHSSCCQKCAPSCQWVCEKVMKTMTRTRYEYVNETKTNTVYDIVYEKECVQDVERVAETHYRDEPFTYHRTVYETQTHEVPYTFKYPVYETRTREVSYMEYVPSYETRVRSIPYTVCRPVQEQRMRTVCYTVPRLVRYTKTVPIPCGHWETRVEEHPGPTVCRYVQEPGCWISTPCQKGSCQKGTCQKSCCQKGGRVYQPGKCRVVQMQCPPVKVCRKVWVPRVEQRVINCCRTEYDVVSQQVPFTVTRIVPETRTYDCEYTVMRNVGISRTKLVHYQVARVMTEQRTRTVTHPIAKSVPATGMRKVPYTTYRDIPFTRTVCKARSVPRQVTCTVCRCVPHTETYQVPYYIYKQVPCGGKVPCQKPCQKSLGFSALEAGSQLAENVVTEDANDISASVSEEPTLAANEELKTFSLKTVSFRAAPAVSDADAERAAEFFSAGLEAYRGRKFADACKSFEKAAQTNGSDARYVYFHALTLYKTDRKADAERKLQVAVDLERDAPIANWGRLMERVQGLERLWVEEARQTL